MMLDDAARGGPCDGVMASDVTDHPAHGGALQTAFGGSNPWKRGEGCGHEDSDDELVHVDPPRTTGGYKTPLGVQSCNRCAT
jgi:hypothetical protein